MTEAAAAHSGVSPELGDVLVDRDYVVDEVDLFLFSAASWLPHRIHYDREFARAEGLDGTPVHGPLQAAWLLQSVEEWARRHGASLRSSSVRHVASAYPRETLHLSVVAESTDLTPEGSELTLALRIAKDDGTLTTSGTAYVEVAVDATPPPPVKRAP